MISKTIHSILFIILAVGHCSYGQQLSGLPTFMYNGLPVNPAYSGYYNNPDVSFHYLGNFNSSPGNAANIGATLNVPVEGKNIGFGTIISQDQIGVTTSTLVKGTFAYKIQSRNKNPYSNWKYYPTSFSMGVSVGLGHYKEDLQSLAIDNDPRFQNNINSMQAIFGAGVLLSHSTYYIGFSMPNLGLKLNTDELYNVQEYHFYLNGGWLHEITPEAIFKLNGQVKAVHGAPIQLEMNGIYAYKHTFEFGLGFQTSKALNAIFTLYLSKNWRMGYHYSHLIAQQQALINPQHGLLLSYRMHKGF